MPREATKEGWESLKIFTDEHLEANDKGSTDCGFYFLRKGRIAENEGLGVEYLRQMEKVAAVKKHEGMH